MEIGALYLGHGKCRFSVWGPKLSECHIHLFGKEGSRLLPMERAGNGYWVIEAEGVYPSDRYTYRLASGKEFPDPASRFQPKGVHGPSAVVDLSSFPWTDGQWQGRKIEEFVLYEIHVGTFTPQGTFEAILPRLPQLRELGITALELMPVGQFPGRRNWGYDGAYPFAVQESYGGPRELQRLVNEAHRQGLAVVLDVVYNHFGPEGSYVGEFGPYYSESYRTPWGAALNFDGEWSDGVRNFFIENALYWLREFHVDGLRLDAVHAICDQSETPFLSELASRVDELSHALGRRLWLFIESERNDARLLRPMHLCGYGLHAQWCEDFHHSLHAFLTGENYGYYADFGRPEDLVKALSHGYVYDGLYSVYRKRRFGNSPKGLARSQFVVFSQNHDQVGNRPRGERLCHLLGWEATKVAAGLVLLSGFIPLLFMGEEYGDPSPFLYFIDHGDPGLRKLVAQGRKRDLERLFGPLEGIPDPGDEETFRASKLKWELRETGRHSTLRFLYQNLLALRKAHCVFLPEEGVERSFRWDPLAQMLSFVYKKDKLEALLFFQLAEPSQDFACSVEGSFRKVLDSADALFEGPGASAPEELSGELLLRLPVPSFAVYLRSDPTKPKS
jgi:maltooligosyltrehalose trehalohydrolase